MTYDQVPIRMELTFTVPPPVAPIDANTGGQVRLWRAADTVIQVGLFQNNGLSLDLSNLTSLQLIVQKSPTSDVRVIDKTVLAASIIPTIDRSEWLSGDAQQASIVLTKGETDLNLDGLASADYWLILKGNTAAGTVVNYGGGYVTVYESGQQLPAPSPSGIVSYHEQVNTAGNFTVTPTSLLHKEVVTVNGVARTSVCILATAGMIAGNVLETVLAFAAPLVPGIIVEVRSGIVGGPLLTTIVTDGFQPNVNIRATFDGAAFKLLSVVNPAFFS